MRGTYPELLWRSLGSRPRQSNLGLALSCLARERPDVVVLDFHLPDMTGAEILQRIRADERLAGVPVIIATARSQMAEGLEEEADLVLVKPVLYNELQERAIELAHGRGRML